MSTVQIRGSDVFTSKLEVSEEIFNSLIEDVPWRNVPIIMFGRKVMQPRLVSLYGHDYRYSGITLKGLSLTPLIYDLKTQVENVCQTTFNSVLLNLYRNGKDHIGWHADDEPELGPDPTIASLSIGAPRLFQLRKNDMSDHIDLPLFNGSLVIMTGSTQREWKHRLPKSSQADTSPRINLTFRQIV